MNQEMFITIVVTSSYHKYTLCLVLLEVYDPALLALHLASSASHNCAIVNRPVLIFTLFLCVMNSCILIHIAYSLMECIQGLRAAYVGACAQWVRNVTAWKPEYLLVLNTHPFMTEPGVKSECYKL